MRDPNRIPEVLAALEKAWKANPELRLGQLLSNLMGVGPRDLFFIEDETWLKLLIGQ